MNWFSPFIEVMFNDREFIAALTVFIFECQTDKFQKGMLGKVQTLAVEKKVEISAMIVGIGVDILQMTRLSSLLARTKNPSRFALRILSQNEYADYKVINCADERLRYLAARWTSKEAIYKAVYPREKLSWKNITIFKCNDEKPLVTIAGNETLVAHISMTHDADLVVAVAVIVEEDKAV
jgi:holo-[acyl-carrier protein] synthase